jgi:threonine synthase
MSLRYVSTGASSTGGAAAVTLGEAVVRGLAPDGGLYVPQAVPRLPAAAWQGLAGAGLPELAVELLAPWTEGTFDRATLERTLADALDFPVPLVRLSDDLFLLELFHGPTLAFKDFGARVMARWIAALDGRAQNGDGDGRPLTVLVATSGDTGSAVASAFHGVAGTRVAVLYPRGQVSPRQERQMATLGGNVIALAVEGTFDDCQRLVKAAFADPDLARRHRLTSANSINLGRLLPQMVYYAHGLLRLPRPSRGPARPTLVATPCGNFGNLTAGLWLQAMLGGGGEPPEVPGLAGFVAATNANDVVPRFLDGEGFTPRPSLRTLANAMDVGDPSNLARIRWLVDDDLERLRRRVVAWSAWDDDALRGAIGRLYRDTGHVVCPHTAAGVLAMEQALAARPGNRGLVLATAHPAKFAEVVEPLVGPVEVPPALAAAMSRPLLSVAMAPTLAALGAALGATDGATLG